MLPPSRDRTADKWRWSPWRLPPHKPGASRPPSRPRTPHDPRGDEGRASRIRKETQAMHSRSGATVTAHSPRGGVPRNWMVKWAGPFPPFADSAAGARVRRLDGVEFVDFALGDTGAMA